MIKCPQCNYHNIDDHRFCQQCGTSLTQKNCANCGHLVDFDATHCPQCSHPTATIWRTILTVIEVEPTQSLTDSHSNSQEVSSGTTPSQPTNTVQVELSEDPSTEELLDTIDQLVNASPEEPGTVELSPTEPQIALLQTMAAKENLDPPPSPIHPAIQSFLNQNPRYRLLEEASALTHTHPPQPGHHEFNILDTQPLRVSPLTVMLNQLQGATHPADMGKPGTIASFLETQPLTFPVVLEPYLALRQQFPLLLPHVHDAWQSEQQSVVLLENRMELPTLKETIMGSTVTSTQVLHWLQQTLDFVRVCSPWQCAPSVLNIDNLRVEQGQILCLQQLMFEADQGVLPFDTSGETASTRPSVWDDLRCAWLDLLQGLGAALSAELQPLLTHLQTAVDVTQEELHRYLSDLHQQLSSSGASAEDVQNPQRLNSGEGGAAPTLILPNKLIYLGAAGLTDDGRDRHHNEDYFVIEQHLHQCIGPHQHQVSGRGLYILCDGMGGHAGGEVASSLAAETLRQYFQTHWQDDLPDAEMLKEATYTANHALFQVNEEKAGSHRMGTTLVMALIQDTHVHILHVGDSRLYRLTHQQGLEQLTVDHEVGQREIQRGVAPEIAYARPDAYQLTQALGPRENEVLVPDTQFLTVNEDTLFLICSDGLTDNQLLETFCNQHLFPMLNTQLSLQQGVNNLVALANEHNGHDNITVIAILMRVHPQTVSSS